MPLPMVHLAVGYELSSKIPIGSLGDFYVGNIAPDAIHMRKNALPEDKKETHFHCKNLSSEDLLIKVVREFHYNEIQRLDHPRHRAFTAGYCTHLMTDYYWFKTIFQEFMKKVPLEVHSEDFKKEYYRDTDFIDSQLYHGADWRESVWNQLRKGKTHSNHLLNEGEIARWTERTLNWFSGGKLDSEESSRFIEYGSVARFIMETSEKISGHFLTMDISL